MGVGEYCAYANASAEVARPTLARIVLRERESERERGRENKNNSRVLCVYGDVGAVTDLGSTWPLSAFSTVVGGGCPVTVSPENFFPQCFVSCIIRYTEARHLPHKNEMFYKMFTIIYRSRNIV